MASNIQALAKITHSGDARAFSPWHSGSSGKSGKGIQIMVDRQDDHSDMPSGRPLEEATVEEFAVSFRGELIRPEDVSYDGARKVYNGLIDKRPALIVRPTGSADVIDAVNLARENSLPLAVRCGGHSVAGKGVVDDGVLIDLSSLKGVRVDPTSRRARANAGVLWGEFDREPQLFGLATPGGRAGPPPDRRCEKRDSGLPRLRGDGARGAGHRDRHRAGTARAVHPGAPARQARAGHSRNVHR